MRASYDEAPFVDRIALLRERVVDPNAYPFAIPALRSLDVLKLAAVTYFVGENGSGKSTLLEAIAIASGFNAEGGSANFRFATRRSESSLHRALRLSRVAHPRTGYFLRAESFFNVATEIERLDGPPGPGKAIAGGYGERALHEQSHGESFVALVTHRFRGHGLYVLDEPEAALSPARQLSLLVRMRALLAEGSQFIIATHAPIVLAYPRALIYELGEHGIARVAYDETSQVSVTKNFLNDRAAYLERLFDA
jgi:predicted ATPase